MVLISRSKALAPAPNSIKATPCIRVAARHLARRPLSPVVRAIETSYLVCGARERANSAPSALLLSHSSPCTRQQTERKAIIHIGTLHTLHGQINKAKAMSCFVQQPADNRFALRPPAAFYVYATRLPMSRIGYY
jgi:hypothetical protein